MAEPFNFDAATPQERNEAIALALGWVHADSGYWIPPEYVGVDAVRGVHPKEFDRMGEYDWQGSDGRAFADLWPEVTKLDNRLVIGLSQWEWDVDTAASPSVMKFDGNGVLSIFDAGTWAHAICKAFLALKGASHGKS